MNGCAGVLKEPTRSRIAISKAFDAGWAAHRDGIHWKRCGLADDELK
jgi:hypothetical protein